MMGSLFDNFPIKLAALLLGVLLWFHVATEKTYNYEVQLPLTDVALGPGLALTKHPPDSLEVVVSATGKQLLRQSWRERGLRVNAIDLEAGRHKLDLTPSNTSLISGRALLSLDKIVYPTSAELYVDLQSQTTVPVIPDLEAVPDDGFAIASISEPEPAEVVVSGPRSLLGSHSSVFTERKNLTGLRNDLTIVLPLAEPAGYGISLDPDSVSLHIKVVPVRTRVFEDIPVVPFNTPPDKECAVFPESLTVVLTGPPDDVDALEARAIVATADYSAAGASGRAKIRIECPAPFTVKSISVDSVSFLVP